MENRKETFFKEMHFFPYLESGSLSQVTTEIGGVWPLGKNLSFGSSLSHRFNSTDSSFDLDQMYMALNLEYLMSFK